MTDRFDELAAAIVKREALTKRVDRRDMAQELQATRAHDKPESPWRIYECARRGIRALTPRLRGRRVDTDSIAGLFGYFVTEYMLTAWRWTKGVYVVDPDIETALAETDLPTSLPVGVFDRMPEWAPYVAITRLPYAEKFAGALFYVDWNVAADHRPELLVMWVPRDPETQQAETDFIPLSNIDIIRQAGEMSDRIAFAVSLALLLCAEDALDERPDRPRPAKTRQRRSVPRLVAAAEPRRWNVAVRLGAELRRAWRQAEGGPGDADQGAGGRAVRPHVRRAHWALYWTGPGRTVPAVRWRRLAIIGTIEADDTPAVVRPVQAE